MNAGASYFQDESRQIWAAGGAVILIALPWFFAPAPELPLVLVLAIAALVIGINHTVLVLSIFLCFSLLRLHELYPAIYQLRLPLAFSAITFVAASWHLIVTRRLDPFWSFELGAFLVFFALVTLGIGFAESVPLAWSYWASVFWKIAAITLLIAWIPRDAGDFQLLAKAFVIAGLAVAAAAIYNKYLGVGLVQATRVTVARDIDGNLGDPNELALVLLIPLSFSLALATYQSNAFNRVLGLVAALTILVAIVFTQSRGGLLATLAVLGVFGLRLRSRMLLAVLALVVTFVLYEAMGISERTAEYGGISFDDSVLDRLRAWQGALAMAADRPLNGVGLRNFADSLPSYQPQLSMAAHSTWLGVLAETGIPGFVAFVVLVIASVSSALRSRFALHQRENGETMKLFSTGLVASFAGFCVAGSFLTHGFTWPFYILVGLTVALSRYVRELPAPHPTR